MAAAVPDPGGIPHYFGPYANWAYSPLPTGAVTSIMLLSGGSGYTAPVVDILDLYETGTGATASATIDPATGAITGITIGSGGTGYSAPQVIITDATGTGAAATAAIGGALTGGITKFIDALPGLTIAIPDTTTYPSGGSGYTSTPTITITDATGTGATAHAVMDLVSGTVASVVVDTPGSGYSANPVVTFSGGGATSQALAIATVDLVPTSPTFGQITGITPTGADYYEIELGEYTQQMHSNLLSTTLRGYRQTNMGGTPFSYLGPVIVAERNKPVLIKFTNNLPTGTGGNLFIPVDRLSWGRGCSKPMILPILAPSLWAISHRTAQRYISMEITAYGLAMGRHTSGLPLLVKPPLIPRASVSTMYPICLMPAWGIEQTECRPFTTLTSRVPVCSSTMTIPMASHASTSMSARLRAI
ncbi:MAG: hypothetical protein AB1480_08470 [Nitrospirota bacterium]